MNGQRLHDFICLKFLSQQISLLLIFWFSGTELLYTSNSMKNLHSVILPDKGVTQEEWALSQSYNTVSHELLDLFCCPGENWLAQKLKLSCALKRAD